MICSHLQACIFKRHTGKMKYLKKTDKYSSTQNAQLHSSNDALTRMNTLPVNQGMVCKSKTIYSECRVNS